MIDNIRLSPIVEGVEGCLTVRGAVVRVVVSAQALQERFGANSERASWLTAFEEHVQAIHEAALRRHRTTGKALIVIDA